jgi:hypothetical protein
LIGSKAEPVDSPRAEYLTRRTTCLVLFVSLLAVYHLNGTVIEEGDTIANIAVPVALFSRGRLSFNAQTNPEIFKWKSRRPLEPQDDFYVRSWRMVVEGQLTSAWRGNGALRFNGPRYFAVKAPRRDTYVNTFGPVVGLSLAPWFAPLMALDKLFVYKVELKLAVAKLHAACLIAASAIFVYLMALAFTSQWLAVLLALAYGLGSCAWSIASQALWQQTLSMFLLGLGGWLFLARAERRLGPLWCGLAFGAALGCRHTALLLIVPVGLSLWQDRRRAGWLFGLGLLPVPLAVAAYNQHFFGSPWSFAQELVGHAIAVQKTGAPELWQTPLWLGTLGLLFCPSRGLAVFSPFLLGGFWGVARIWRDARFARLRPLTLGVLAVMLLQAKWFDWWGGWAFGYRPWLDMMPLFSVFMAPVLQSISDGRWKALWALALAWSVFVQLIGAFAYDKSWNARPLFLVEHRDGHREVVYDSGWDAEARAKLVNGRVVAAYRCNVDERACRYRLWSLEDNVIRYYIANFSATRRELMRSGWDQFEIR